jgi:hypothetical protein
MLHLNHGVFKASLFTPSQEIPIIPQIFPYDIPSPTRDDLFFGLVLDGWPKRAIIGNLSSAEHALPSHPFSH